MTEKERDRQRGQSDRQTKKEKKRRNWREKKRDREREKERETDRQRQRKKGKRWGKGGERENLCVEQGSLHVGFFFHLQFMEASDITSRAEKVSAVVLAEMYHFHRERVVDFRDMMKFFLQEQIDFYQRVSPASHRGCGWMLLVGVVFSVFNTGALLCIT